MKKIAIGLTTISLVFFTSCGSKNEGAQGPQQAPPPSLKVSSLKKQNVTTFDSYATTIEGKQNVEIRPKVSGFVQKIYVEEGQKVKKGQLLFKLETESLSQDANAAKAAVNAAQVEVDKLKPLVEKNIISNVQLETAKAQLEQAKSSYQSITANIGYSRVTSPVDGYIGEIPFKVGTLVSSTTAQPLTTVSDISEVRAYFSLNEKELLEIKERVAKEGRYIDVNKAPEVELIMINGEPYEHKGKIAMVNSIINSTTGSVTLRADFKNPKLILSSGSTGEIKIPTEQKDIFVIPKMATLDIQGNKLVYVLQEDNTIKTQHIKIVDQTDADYLVSQGIEEGTTIVIEGVSKLRDGQEISPVK
ncbi:efflux RND transporter periplasmic adaptor subunit [Croceivirga sp. JEA036]|uniref:efflux RND transporter periplasmic adaptor subunit n=1 Tax=Croceivirga sp. JEA036 TaxID=2721162 RepID=UPI00143C2FA7|nr:efflux RND transporter periplasmic adaptor subunit [Croceivirga sp. JEA036]NJB36953.1 efflux RND transporter periplasmic adaptor subunit [Croceivirga sp. JEA036]